MSRTPQPAKPAAAATTMGEQEPSRSFVVASSVLLVLSVRIRIRIRSCKKWSSVVVAAVAVLLLLLLLVVVVVVVGANDVSMARRAGRKILKRNNGN